MTRRKVLRRETSGCCWRKLLGIARKRGPNLNGRPNKPHQCFDQDEIVYLNLYLTTLEKKMQAIEEITRLKWYRKQMFNSTGDAQNCIRSGFKYFKEDAVKPLLSRKDDYTTELSTVKPAPQKPEIMRGSSEAILREIMSLGSRNYSQDLESQRWAALAAPQREQNLIIADPDKIMEINVESETEVQISQPFFSVVGTYHVAAVSYPFETHVATQKEEARVEKPTIRIKASCSIDFFDNEAKSIEISYDNREWDKKGTIVLRDVENQIGVQTELIGRVVCFLLGMGEGDWLEQHNNRQ